GRLQTRTYKDKNETSHNMTELLVDKWYLVAVSEKESNFPVKEKTIVKDSLTNDSLNHLSLSNCLFKGVKEHERNTIHKPGYTTSIQKNTPPPKINERALKR